MMWEVSAPETSSTNNTTEDNGYHSKNINVNNDQPFSKTFTKQNHFDRRFDYKYIILVISFIKL